MASTVVKKHCTKCRERKKTAAVACNGCQQLFCVTCITEHQQELAIQIDDVNREHDSLKQQFSQEYDTHVILSRINVWEKESIARIQTDAETTRIDLQEWTYRNTKKIKPLLDTMTNELANSRKLKDYS